MKPAPFKYFRPSSLDEALATMAAHAGDAKALAGGQSLVPAMNFRIAQPAALVDLNGLSELDGIEVKDRELRIGALTTLDALAADCSNDGVYEFLFVAQPLRIPGAVGSPINPLAIK